MLSISLNCKCRERGTIRLVSGIPIPVNIILKTKMVGNGIEGMRDKNYRAEVGIGIGMREAVVQGSICTCKHLCTPRAGPRHSEAKDKILPFPFQVQRST